MVRGHPPPQPPGRGRDVGPKPSPTCPRAVTLHHATSPALIPPSPTHATGKEEVLGAGSEPSQAFSTIPRVVSSVSVSPRAQGRRGNSAHSLLCISLCPVPWRLGPILSPVPAPGSCAWPVPSADASPWVQSSSLGRAQGASLLSCFPFHFRIPCRADPSPERPSPPRAYRSVAEGFTYLTGLLGTGDRGQGHSWGS